MFDSHANTTRHLPEKRGVAAVPSPAKIMYTVNRQAIAYKPYVVGVDEVKFDVTGTGFVGVGVGVSAGTSEIGCEAIVGVDVGVSTDTAVVGCIIDGLSFQRSEE